MTSSSPHPMASGGEASRLLSLLLTDLPLARGQCLVLAYSFQKLVERAKLCVIKPAFTLSCRPCEVIGKSALGLQGVRHVRISPRECRELVTFLPSLHQPASVCTNSISTSLRSALTFFRCSLQLKNICFSSQCLQNGNVYFSTEMRPLLRHHKHRPITANNS